MKYSKRTKYWKLNKKQKIRRIKEQEEEYRPFKKYKRNKRNNKRTAWYKLRFSILARDNFTCQYCGRNPQDGIKLVIDHKNPKSKGGLNNPNNLVTSCEVCNIGKGDIVYKSLIPLEIN